jgi:hypothetical protein
MQKEKMLKMKKERPSAFVWSMDLGFEVLGIQQPKWMTNVQMKEKIKCRTNNQLG